MRIKILIIGILLLVAVISVVVKKAGDKKSEAGLLLSGNVEVTEAGVGFKIPGRIVELFAEEGQKIGNAEKLAALDSAELESNVNQAQAYLDEAKARLEELKTGSRPQELEQAKADVNYAETELNNAKSDFERAEMLFRDELISVQQMDAAKKTYDVAVAQHKKAVASLSLVKEGARKEEILAAMSRVRQAEAALKTSEERLKDTVIYSPFSGVILRKNIEAGETASAGSPVYTIGDIGHPWVKVYVKEDKLGYVKLGQKAEIRVDSYPNKIYEGTVTYISSEAEFTPKNIQTQEERVKLVFGVKVSVKNINDELKPGLPADVRIFLQ